MGCVDLDGSIIVNLCRRICTSRKADAIGETCGLAGAIRAVFQIRSCNGKSLDRTICIRYRRNRHIAAILNINSLHGLLLDGIIGHIELDSAIVAYCCRRIGAIGKDKAIRQMDGFLFSIRCLYGQIIHIDSIDILSVTAHCLRNGCYVSTVGHFRGCFCRRSSQFALGSSVQIPQRQGCAGSVIACKGNGVVRAILGNSGIGVLEAGGSDRIPVRIGERQGDPVLIPCCGRHGAQFVVGGIDGHGAVRSYRCRGMGAVLEIDSIGQGHSGACAIGFHGQIIHIHRVGVLVAADRIRQSGIGALGKQGPGIFQLAVVHSIGIV